MDRGGPPRPVEEAERDARPPVLEGGVAPEPDPRIDRVDVVRKIPEAPGGDPGALERPLRGAGEAPGRLDPEPALELVEVAAAPEHLPVRPDDLEAHVKPGGQQIGPELGGFHLDSRHLPQRRREGGGKAGRGQVRPREAAPGGVAERKRSAGGPGAGRVRRSATAFSSRMAGHEPLEALALEGAEHGGRDPGGDPVVRLFRRESGRRSEPGPPRPRSRPESPRPPAAAPRAGAGPSSAKHRSSGSPQRLVPAPEAPRSLATSSADRRSSKKRARASSPARRSFRRARRSISRTRSSIARLYGARTGRIGDETRPPSSPSDDEDRRAPPAGSTGANRTRRRGTRVRPKQHHPLERHHLAPLRRRSAARSTRGSRARARPARPTAGGSGPRRGRIRPTSPRAPRPRSSAPRTASPPSPRDSTNDPVPRAAVLAPLRPHPDVRDAAREHRAVDLGVGRGPRARAEADLPRRDEELAVDVHPLAHAARREGELLATLAPGGGSEGAGPRR